MATPPPTKVIPICRLVGRHNKVSVLLHEIRELFVLKAMQKLNYFNGFYNLKIYQLFKVTIETLLRLNISTTWGIWDNLILLDIILAEDTRQYLQLYSKFLVFQSEEESRQYSSQHSYESGIRDILTFCFLTYFRPFSEWSINSSFWMNHPNVTTYNCTIKK